jgi:hypothetical protein
LPCLPVLQTCLSDIEFRIVSLEAELALLKREAGDLRARRAAAQQHHEHRLQAIRSGRPESGASPAEIAAAVSGGLASLHGLSAALLGGEEGAGRGEPAAAAAAAAKSAAALGQQVMEAEVPIKLLGAMQQVVELSLLQLHELGSKARFFQERLAKVSCGCAVPAVAAVSAPGMRAGLRAGLGAMQASGTSGSPTFLALQERASRTSLAAP